MKRYFGALESSKTSIPYGQSGHASTPNDSIDCGHVGWGHLLQPDNFGIDSNGGWEKQYGQKTIFYVNK